MQLTGIILAGGKSSRMKEDKSLLFFNGKRLIDWSIILLEELCDSIIISSNNNDLKSSGYLVVVDQYRNIGPIGGLVSALKASETEQNIVIACDTPKLNKYVYEKILNNSSNYDAIVAGLSEQYIEPLIGYYNKKVIDILEKQIGNNEFKIQDAFKHMMHRVEIFTEKDLFKNINYPSDLL